MSDRVRHLRARGPVLELLLTNAAAVLVEFSLSSAVMGYQAAAPLGIEVNTFGGWR